MASNKPNRIEGTSSQHDGKSTPVLGSSQHHQPGRSLGTSTYDNVDVLGSQPDKWDRAEQFSEGSSEGKGSTHQEHKADQYTGSFPVQQKSDAGDMLSRSFRHNTGTKQEQVKTVSDATPTPGSSLVTSKIVGQVSGASQTKRNIDRSAVSRGMSST